MRFQKLTSPAALFLTCIVLLNCPTIIGQVLQPIQQQSGTSPAPNETGTRSGKTTVNTQKEPAPYKLSSRFHLQKGTNAGYLIVKVEMPQGSYIYSTTQRAPLRPSKIQVAESNQFRIKGKFTPDRPATVVEKDPILEQRLEKHMDVVQFFAAIEIAPGVAPEAVVAHMAFSGQVCDDRGYCVPIFAAKTKGKFAGYFERSAATRTTSQSGPSIGNQPR
jgi:hypothetical protein